MYTKIGDQRPWRRGTKASLRFTEVVRQMTAENAYRYIFAAGQDSSVSKLRPRVVDQDQLQREKAHWEQWHEQNSKAEAEYLQ